MRKRLCGWGGSHAAHASTGAKGCLLVLLGRCTRMVGSEEKQRSDRMLRKVDLRSVGGAHLPALLLELHHAQFRTFEERAVPNRLPLGADACA